MDLKEFFGFKNSHPNKLVMGPRLFCERCGQKEVLSPCYSCQLEELKALLYCRGCGCMPCKQEYEICKFLTQKKLMLKFDKIFATGDIQADFHSQQLQELPAEIGQLTHLKYLILSDNQLNQLPPEIGLLTRLESLKLNKNLLQQLPQEIGQLTNLKYLELEENQLHELPGEIGFLINLQELYLNGNKLRKLPQEICFLSNLNYLGLDGDQLREFPKARLLESLECLAQLTNLKSLTLYNTQLSADTINSLRTALPNTYIMTEVLF